MPASEYWKWRHCQYFRQNQRNQLHMSQWLVSRTSPLSYSISSCLLTVEVRLWLSLVQSCTGAHGNANNLVLKMDDFCGLLACWSLHVASTCGGRKSLFVGVNRKVSLRNLLCWVFRGSDRCILCCRSQCTKLGTKPRVVGCQWW